MRQIILNIPESKFSFFMQLVHSLNFVQVAENQSDEMEVKIYNPDFVAKIQKSKQEFEEGDFTTIKKEDLKQFLGL